MLSHLMMCYNHHHTLSTTRCANEVIKLIHAFISKYICVNNILLSKFKK